MTNLDSMSKSRGITLPTKVRLVKVMVFPVVMYGCESWTVKKAKHRSIDAFELWCWRRLLRVTWTARRSSQSILKEISPGCSLELWPPDVKSWLIWKDPDAGKDWGQQEKGTTEDEMVGRHHRLNGQGFGWTLGVGDGQGGLVCCGSWGHKELDTTERLNWTDYFFQGGCQPFRISSLPPGDGWLPSPCLVEAPALQALASAEAPLLPWPSSLKVFMLPGEAFAASCCSPQIVDQGEWGLLVQWHFSCSF